MSSNSGFCLLSAPSAPSAVNTLLFALLLPAGPRDRNRDLAGWFGQPHADRAAPRLRGERFGNRDPHRRHRTAAGRTLHEHAGQIAYAARNGSVTLIHTEIDPAFKGQGLGDKIVSAALADLEELGLRMIPVCPFVRSYLERHPE